MPRTELAQDIMQDCYLRVHRYLPSYKVQVGKALPWLLGITHNCIIDHLQKNKDNDPFYEDGFHKSFHKVEEEDRLFLKDMLKDLREDDRQLLIDRFIRELSFEEIADQHSIKSETARQRVSRLMKKLRSRN